VREAEGKAVIRITVPVKHAGAVVVILTRKEVILWLRPRKHLAPFALVITLYNREALVPSLDLAGHYRGFLFRREALPIEGRVGPENMVMNR